MILQRCIYIYIIFNFQHVKDCGLVKENSAFSTFCLLDVSVLIWFTDENGRKSIEAYVILTVLRDAFNNCISELTSMGAFASRAHFTSE